MNYRRYDPMDHLSFVKEWLEKGQDAWISGDLCSWNQAIHIATRLNCWVKYDRPRNYFVFKN